LLSAVELQENKIIINAVAMMEVNFITVVLIIQKT